MDSATTLFRDQDGDEQERNGSSIAAPWSNRRRVNQKAIPMMSTRSMAAKHPSKGEYLLVQAQLPGTEVENIGVLLIDTKSDQLYIRIRRDFGIWAGEAADWFESLGGEILERSRELGGKKCLSWMESTLSNTLRVSDRVGVIVDNSHQTIQQLYAKYVRPKVLPFYTHLPQITLEAAAGTFGKRTQVEPEGWVEVWTSMNLTKDMFVTHVKGYSMEPQIPDGSLCAIAGTLAGSPNGKVVLVEDYRETEGSRYTIERYRVSMNADLQAEGGAARSGAVRVLGEVLFVV